MPEDITIAMPGAEPITGAVATLFPAVAAEGNPLLSIVPGFWQDFLAAPWGWMASSGEALLDFFLNVSGWGAVFSYTLLLFPAFLLFGGICSTSLAVYSLPFRSGRLDFIKMMFLAWWDAGLAIWLYWVGLGRFIFVIFGWFFLFGRFAMQMIAEVFRQLIILPFSKTGQMTRSYFQPGVPWIAFLLVVFWSLVEALIFTYTLYPTITEVLAGIVGSQPPPLTAPLLYVFLAFLILGSFACIHALAEAVKNKEYKYIVQMVVIEIFVMVFEVMFLYRELVDAITPWIAQQTSEQFRPGIFFTLGLATFAWIGIRGMTWFLFGQYGTPPLLAFISRRPMVDPDSMPQPALEQGPPPAPWWKAPLEDFKKEIGWLHDKACELLEYLTLPFIHVLAGTLNFGIILVTGNRVFTIPFKSLQEALQVKESLPFLRVQAKKANA